MTDADVLATWMADESLLAQIGARLSEQPTEIEVRIPRGLADAAVEAGQRDGDSDLTGEKCENGSCAAGPRRLPSLEPPWRTVAELTATT